MPEERQKYNKVVTTVVTGKFADGGGFSLSCNFQPVLWTASSPSHIYEQYVQNPTKDNPAIYAEYREIYPVGTPRFQKSSPVPGRPALPNSGTNQPRPDSTP